MAGHDVKTIHLTNNQSLLIAVFMYFSLMLGQFSVKSE